MKKILDFIKNNYKYFLLFLLVTIWNLFFQPLNLDEVWNYGFAHNIYSGLIPYKDFNMVITPLYPMIISLFFKIFHTSNILIMNIINSLMLTHLFILINKLVKDNALIILLFFFFPLTLLFPSYNLFLLYLFVLIIYFEKNKKSDYLIGFLIACTILTKHVVGIFFLIATIIIVYKDKEKIFKRLVSCFSLLLIFLIYLIFTKSLVPFLDYCVFGLFDFSKSNGNYHNFLFMLSIILLITLIFDLKKNPRDFTIYLLGFMINIIPLFDLYHFNLWLIAYLIIFFSKRNINFKINMNLIVITIISCQVLFNLKQLPKKNLLYPNNVNHFEYHYLSEKFLKYTNEVNLAIKKYQVKKKKVIIIGSDGYYFKLINDEKIDKFDLLNMGNNGYNGSKKLISDIKKIPNTIFFVDKDELGLGNQTDQKLIKYILKNAHKISKVSFYDVYTFD